MFLSELSISGFKNIDRATIEFGNSINCLTGLNGMGKTNCLDAIFLLCVGKSHFNINDQQLIRQGSDFFRVDGIFHDKNDHKHKVSVKLQEAGKKSISLDGKPYRKIADHLGRFPVVMIAPDDTGIVTGASELRRKFVDTSLCQTDAAYLASLGAYNKILKQRNACLKMFSASGVQNIALLETYDVQLSSHASVIHLKRKEYIRQLNEIFMLKYGRITSGNEQVGVAYQSQLNDASMMNLLTECRRKDLATERTHAGIHKDDLVINIEQREARKFASQGQVKSLLFALKFAEYKLVRELSGSKPILLLDDIFDKLDDTRVHNLLDLLRSTNFGQVFITDTSSSRLGGIISGVFEDFCSFSVADGEIKPVIYEKT